MQARNITSEELKTQDQFKSVKFAVIFDSCLYIKGIKFVSRFRWQNESSLSLLFKKVRGWEEALIQKQRLFDFLGGGKGRLLDRERLFEEIGYLVKPSTKKLKPELKL